MLLPKLKDNKGKKLLFIILSVLIANNLLFAQSSDDQDLKKMVSKAEMYAGQSIYDSAIILYDSVIELEGFKAEWEKQAQYILRIIELYRTTKNFVKADSCLGAVENNPNINLEDYPLLYAEYLHQKGTSMGDQGKYSDAIPYLNRAIDVRVGINGPGDTLLAKTFNNIGAYSYYLGDIKKALSFYEKALELAIQTKGQQSEVALFMQNIGIIYARMGDFEKALNYFNQNLDINKNDLSPDDPKIAQIYLNLGQLYSLLSRFDEALDYNDKAEKIYINKFGKEYGSLGTIYLNKSRIYGELSDPEEAEKYLKSALNIYSIYLKPDHPNIARIYNNLGFVALSKKDYKEAINYYQKSLGIQKDPDSQAIQLRNLAYAYSKLNDFDEAERYFMLSIDKAQKELGENHFEYGNSLQKFGEFLLEQQKFEEAKGVMQKAIKNHLSIYGARNANVAEVYLLYGQCFFVTGDYQSGLEYYQKAMIANDNVFSDSDIFVNSNQDHVISQSLMLTIILNKAEAFTKLYNENKSNTKFLDAALSCYQDAMPVYEDLRAKLKYESKFILAEETKKHFDKAYQSYFERYANSRDYSDMNVSFEFVEKNKAAVLLSSMKNMDAIKFGGIPEEYQSMERSLTERINGYENLIYDQKQQLKPDSSRIVLWEKRLFEISNRYDSLIRVFGEKYPAYYNLKYDNTVISIPELQQKIAKDQVIIEFTVTDSALYIFLVSPEKSSFYQTAITNEFYENLELLQNSNSVDFANHKLEDFKSYVKASNEVYQTLFSMVEKDLLNKKMIIVPDGKLGYLSFESLVTKMPDLTSIDYRNLDYLIKNYPISYSYSSTLLFKNVIPKSHGNAVLAFAPDYETNQQSGAEQNTIRELTSQLKPLINAQEEVSNVMDMFHGKVFNNKQATESNFKLNSPKYDVLHLAMHTILDDADPMYSKMIFTPNADTIDDGYLNTFEIYNLNLVAQLAVLSACNTGYGKILNGEGIMSLARGFIYSGVPSIVMTLWEVDDKSGSDIMTGFYRYLKKGQSKDVALQNAKLDYLQTASQLRAHPYFWSAYVNIGSTNPLEKNHLGTYLLISGILLLFFLLLFYIKKKLS